MSNWLGQDVVIEKVQSKINNLRNATYIAEKGQEALKLQTTKEEVIKFIEFKVRAEDYIRFSDFLEEILLDIDLIKQEEVRELEESERDIRDNRLDASLGI